jgi:hypothetical protein
MCTRGTECESRVMLANGRLCEGFRMPAASDDAASSGGRRTKTSKGRNRDLGALAGPRRAACSAMGI